MTFEVPESVLAKTTKCEHGHSCLEPDQRGDKPMCEMDRAYGENLLSVIPHVDKPCPYRVFFGYGFICACPTYSAIHIKDSDGNGSKRRPKPRPKDGALLLPPRGGLRCAPSEKAR